MKSIREMIDRVDNIQTFTNDEDGISSAVYDNPDHFRVVTKDTDSDNVIEVRKFPKDKFDSQAAIDYAKSAAYGESKGSVNF